MKKQHDFFDQLDNILIAINDMLSRNNQDGRSKMEYEFEKIEQEFNALEKRVSELDSDLIPAGWEKFIEKLEKVKPKLEEIKQRVEAMPDSPLWERIQNFLIRIWDKVKGVVRFILKTLQFMAPAYNFIAPILQKAKQVGIEDVKNWAEGFEDFIKRLRTKREPEPEPTA